MRVNRFSNTLQDIGAVKSMVEDAVTTFSDTLHRKAAELHTSLRLMGENMGKVLRSDLGVLDCVRDEITRISDPTREKALPLATSS